MRSANAQRIERLDRPEVIELLARSNLLPAIFFIFSRAGCDAAVQQVLRSGLRTGDIAQAGEKVIGTVEMGDAVVAALRK